MRWCVIAALLCAACRGGDTPAERPLAEAPIGWEGFYAPAAVTDAWLEARKIPLDAAVVRERVGRVAKLVIADGTREADEAELGQMQTRYCTEAAVRAWNEDRCAGLAERECADGRCRYEHFGNCSGLLAGGGLFVTAAHCVAGLRTDPALAARSAILVSDDGGRPGRRLPVGTIRVGKEDFAHDWVALDDDDPVDVASIEVDDGGLAPHPTAPVPGEGEPVFIVGFPRVDGRDPTATRRVGYDKVAGVCSISFGRVADRNVDDLPLCNVDGDQEHWTLRSPCPGGRAGDTWRGEILRSPFLTTYDSINGYSGGPVFDASGRWIGVNATLVGQTNPQTGYDPRTRMVATPVARALARLGARP